MNPKYQIIDRIVSVVNKTAPLSQVFLYGSRAKGNAGKSSDWDVLILMNINKVTFSYETGFMDAFYELELETDEVLSPLSDVIILGLKKLIISFIPSITVSLVFVFNGTTKAFLVKISMETSRYL